VAENPHSLQNWDLHVRICWYLLIGAMQPEVVIILHYCKVATWRCSSALLPVQMLDMDQMADLLDSFVADGNDFLEL
jgi:hypothetical protein